MRLAVAALLTLAAMMLAAPARSAQLDDTAVAAILQADWNSTYEDWKASHPDASCNMDSSDGPSCHVCAAPSSWAYTEWTFYAFGDEDPPRCRLWKIFRRHSLELSLEALDAGFRPTLGPLQHREGDGGTTDPADDVDFWHGAGLEVVATRFTLLARRESLMEALESREAIEHQDFLRESWIDAQIATLAGPHIGEHAAVVRALLSAGGWSLWQIDPDRYLSRMRSEIESLRGEAAAAGPPRRFYLLLAADLLAEEFGHASPVDAKPNMEGLTFEASHLGDCLAYHNDLLRIVLDEAPLDSLPHELAFVWMLDAGFDTSGMCNEGEEQFLVVVREAERVLKAHAGSRIRADVQFMLAQAYETWWSVGSTGSTQTGFASVEAAGGADHARRRAIEIYQQFLRDAPQSEEARAARYALPRLKHGLATGERRFLCFYD